jgi:predicted signal transduction protein with EAL and GGDEF domain
VVLLAGASAGLLFAGGVFYFTRRGLLRSPAQFASGSVEDAVANALKESGLKSNRLELEITERLLLAKTDVIVTTLKRLKAMGVSIVMDDFGTSYSSLSYLWKFRFDKIKIDRSFMDAFKEPDDGVQTVVKSIIELGREMKLRVTVEGVEIDRQVDFLSNANADRCKDIISVTRFRCPNSVLMPLGTSVDAGDRMKAKVCRQRTFRDKMPPAPQRHAFSRTEPELTIP